MKAFYVCGPSGQQYAFGCDDVIDGIPINPVLPLAFDDTPNDARSDRSLAWWDQPFIQIYRAEHPGFVVHWHGNTRYDLRCLDGGAWDRSTCWGMFGTLAEAVTQAGKGPVWLTRKENDLCQEKKATPNA